MLDISPTTCPHHQRISIINLVSKPRNDSYHLEFLAALASVDFHELERDKFAHWAAKHVFVGYSCTKNYICFFHKRTRLSLR